MTPAQLISIHRSVPGSLEASRARILRRDRPKPTPETPLIVSASEVRDFMRCRVRWNWRHQVRLEPLERAEPLAVGTVVHIGVERWYALKPKRRTLKAMQKIAKDVVRDTTIEKLSTENRELCEAMLVGYAAWAIEEDQSIGLTDALPEEWFDLPLTEDGSIRVRGKIDLHWPINKKTVGFLDTKTKSQIRIDMVDTSHQLTTYAWALRVKYPKIRRFRGYYQVLRKQIPGPRVKADLFHREPFERMDDEIDQWIADVQHAARDMLDAAIYPNPMDACSWDCDYRIPCLLRGRPEDLKHVLTTQYRTKEARK